MKSALTNLTLQKKIIAVIVLTTLTVTITVIPIIFFTLRSGMQGQQQRHLAGVKHLVEQLVEDNRRTVRNYAVLFSTDRQVKDNLYYFAELAGERIHPLNAIQHLVDAFELQFVELGDRNGKIVANPVRPDQHDQDKSKDVLIRTALTSGVATGIEKYGHAFLLKAVAPVYHDESQLIGTISIGMIMDDGFVKMIKSLSGVELAIVDRQNRIVASTLDTLLQQQTINPDQKSMRLDNRQFQLMNLPFDNSSGYPLGTVIIMAKDNMSAILNRANFNIILVLLAISIVSISATIFILRRVLSPVEELRKGAEKIGSGEFNHRIAVTSTDEIGSLAEVFNRMAANLQQMREVEEKLKHAERLASIGEFTAATAHELNNPIANIIGLLKVMRSETADDQPIIDDLNIVIKEANRCGAIVRDLLMYSRSSRPSREKISVFQVVKEAIAGIQGKHITDRINILFSTQDPNITVFADPAQIEQVLRNILLNGVQAISRHGTIEVSITRRDDNNNVSIALSDTGCGIAETDLDKIFYPFFTTKKSGEGTGLGLAVCYTIIQSHHGSITAVNNPGKGCTFTINLPSDEDDEQ
jgi:signal transduction histidine kinase